ncbi:cobalamin-dependent protein, partial [Patescibacteria group bacterium]|nr:cobalamin-dependent protein [Patescibacteria group bacterium]
MSKKIKVLIANSVGKDENGNNFILFPSRWTANVGKTKSFNFYPYELAYLSSILKKENYWDVLMVDGNFEALDWKKYFEKYKFVKPDFLVMETSSVVYEMDLKFGLAFKKKYGTKLIFCGQHPSAFAKEVMKDGVDYVCLGEYELTVLDILKGKKRSKIKGLYPNGRRELLEVDCLPFPEDDDISRINYADIG